MYHSIYIGDKNTWDDFHLVAQTRPSVAMPEVRTMYVDIPGTNGSLDLTTALTGEVLYKNREGSWEFTVLNDHNPLGIKTTEWEIIYHNIANYLHGKRLKVVLDDDLAYYYMGRLSVDDWKSEKNYSKITINYYLEPFKNEIHDGLDDWLWDPFNFENGVIREYKNLVVDGTRVITVHGSTRSSSPTFYVASSDGNGMTLTYKTNQYSMIDGANKLANVIVGPEDATFTIHGNGNISISYRGGWL